MCVCVCVCVFTYPLPQIRRLIQMMTSCLTLCKSLSLQVQLEIKRVWYKLKGKKLEMDEALGGTRSTMLSVSKKKRSILHFYLVKNCLFESPIFFRWMSLLIALVLLLVFFDLRTIPLICVDYPIDLCGLFYWSVWTILLSWNFLLTHPVPLNCCKKYIPITWKKGLHLGFLFSSKLTNYR